MVCYFYIDVENNPFLESVYRMEIDCARSGASTVVSGVVGIVEKSDDSIKLMTKIGSVNISGERLNISVFEYKTLQI